MVKTEWLFVSQDPLIYPWQSISFLSAEMACMQAGGLPNFKDLFIDIPSKRVGTFTEQFIMEPGKSIGCYIIVHQELYFTS
ncbi:unnamed protein product [Rhodiola kirilowii]